eukprot:scaffold2530_cov87-Cyclotella_meneghiniana.AAC.8
MPITGEYTWSETNVNIEVLIPLKGVSPKKLDVFTASNILKVAFPPFLIDLNLFAEIEVEQCRAILKEGTLKILLTKKEDRVWGQLCFEGTKEEIKQRRNDALREREQRVKQQMQQAATKKMEEERMVFQQHMAIERKEQQRMNDIKAQEKREAEESMHKTFSDIKENARGHQNEQTLKVICSDNADENVNAVCFDELNEAEDLLDDLPPPRATTHATFRHTPRLFKTPLRESTVKQEQEFIVKNRLGLKKNKLLNVDKMNLQSKGDEFKSRGDYGSAINAYSDALDADPSLIDVMAKRSVCFIELRQGVPCIKDCLDILDMIKNSAEDSTIEIETRIRLGKAYFLTKEYDKALFQFEAAQEIDKNNDTIIDCLNYAKVHSEASARKEEADKLFSCHDFAGAAAEYTKALEVDPHLIAALMNRSACYLGLKQFVSCIADSTMALESLSRGKKTANCVLADLIFPDPCTKRKWTVTLLCRRSAAKRLLGDEVQSAMEDLELAIQHAKRDRDIDSKNIEQEIAVLRKQLSNSS